MKPTASILLICGFVATNTMFAGDPPSLALSRFGQAHLDQILAPIDQNVNLPRNELMQLRESFAAWIAKAPPNEQPAWRVAIGVCDALNNAMDEREKARANLDGSSSVHGSFDLGARRQDRPRYWEYEREQHEEAQRQRDAAQKDVFLNTTLRTQWTQRAMQLRQNIVGLHQRLVQLELQAQQSVGQPAAASADTVILQKPTAVHVKYGTLTLPAGTSLQVMSRDPRGITAEYNGELVIVPPQ
jgi:hypothetical protein